jgi:hypothetical protein
VFSTYNDSCLQDSEGQRGAQLFEGGIEAADLLQAQCAWPGMVVDIAGDGWFESLHSHISHISHGGNGWKWMEMERMDFFCEPMCRVLWAIAGCTSSDLLETWENSVFEPTLHHASIVDSGLQHWQLV